MKKCITIAILSLALAGSAFAQNLCKLYPQIITWNNQMIPLGNRLTAHYVQAQTWEEVNADNPSAVAIRAKIATEETEFVAKNDQHLSLPDTSTPTFLAAVKTAQKDCPADVASMGTVVHEFSVMVDEFVKQRQRYHALGY
jgi:hypothetical protein